jgi:uncharacterized protein (TIGR02145 family)
MYDIDGNAYDTVHIGTQVWMKENLRTSRYSNGDTIPHITNSTIWTNLITGGYCWYNQDSAMYESLYGKLYNFYTVVDGRNLCPTGWHMPSDSEWKTLEMFIGMSPAEADGTLHRGTTEGGELKATGTSLWQAPNTGASDEYGFSAIPAGYSGSVLDFGGMGIQSTFWTATPSNSSTSYNRTIRYEMSTISRSNSNNTAGYSVRCIKN